MYTPRILMFRYRQYSCGQERHDMRSTRVNCGDERNRHGLIRTHTQKDCLSIFLVGYYSFNNGSRSRRDPIPMTLIVHRSLLFSCEAKIRRPILQYGGFSSSGRTTKVTRTSDRRTTRGPAQKDPCPHASPLKTRTEST